MPKQRSALVALRTPDARVSALGIARALARDIERGVHAAGSRLREQQLADQFKCSRAPVREALRILESQGSVIIEPMKGARIATPGDPTFYEVFLIRRALAGLMAQEAANAARSKAKGQFIVLANELPAGAESAKDGHEYAARARQVVRALIEVAQTPRTVQIVRGLTFGHEAFEDDIVHTKKNRQIQAGYWAKMGEAVAASDPIGARAAMDAIFDFSRAYVESSTAKPSVSKRTRGKKRA